MIWVHVRTALMLRKLNSHQYQQLPLIAVDDFLRQRPELMNADEKTLMFARISHELSEREALEQARQGLLKKKQSLIADNKKRKEDLASLDKDLETFIDVSTLLREIGNVLRSRMLTSNDEGGETYPEDFREAILNEDRLLMRVHWHGILTIRRDIHTRGVIFSIFQSIHMGGKPTAEQMKLT